ncbi:MAG: T9SS type A sorting domain-containing protein [Bacteroidales bacterium]|nr:T9SS type A sorting domain-containing protein [Bacteroidales bacterium]
MDRLTNIAFLPIIFCCGTLTIFNSIYAQDWPKKYGDNIHALVSNITESYDLGFNLTAFTYNYQGANDYGWIIKIDINANILWDKKFGDGNYGNWFSNSVNTHDNGLIVSGITNKYGNDYDPLFLKTDFCGEIEWCQVLKCPGLNFGTDVIQLDDGSYVGLLTYYGTGGSYARISLVKMDPSGEPVWIQQLAQEDTLIYNEEGGNLYLTADGNFLVTGHCYYPNLKPFWIKTDTNGNQIWDLKWPGGVGGVHQLIESPDDIYYCSGALASSNMPISPVIYKLDNDGNSIYHAFLLGDTIDGGEAKALTLYNDTVLSVGVIWGTKTFPKVYYSEIILTDTLGSIINRRVLLNSAKAPNSIIKTSDNKILVTGSYVIDNNWDIYLWKMNADLEDDTLYTQPMVYDSLCPYQILSDTIDLDCDIFVNIEDIPTKEVYESTIKISPNPARDWALLTFPENFKNDQIYLTVYNTFGQAVIQKEVTITNNMYTLETSGLPSGLYITICRDKKKNAARGKFVVVR